MLQKQFAVLESQIMVCDVKDTRIYNPLLNRTTHHKMSIALLIILDTNVFGGLWFGLCI